MIKIKWVKIKISTISIPSYIDIDKAYRVTIVKNNQTGKYRARAYFLVSRPGNTEDKQPIYQEFYEKDTSDEVDSYIRELMGTWLHGSNPK